MSRSLLAALTLGCAVAVAAPGAHATTLVTLPAADGPGPAKFDRVRVLKEGPSSAKNVLVLVPGTSAGAGNTTVVGKDLADRLKGWQVWSVDRRENWLEDESTFTRALRGEVTPKAAFDYYLGWIGSRTPVSPRFTPVADKDVPFAKEWGMRTTVLDLQRVVRSARKGGRKVVLGGHSLGASIAQAYATWDFNGRPGARDLSGLLLLDGGGGGGPARPAPTPAAAKASLDKLGTGGRDGGLFLDIVGTGLPWANGVLAELGATLALKAGGEPSTLQGFPLLPANLRPPAPATNRGAFGFAFDTETSPDGLELIQMHMGSLATTGAPRDWIDGGLVPIDRAARIFARAGLGGSAWYHPRRLSLDSSVVNGGQPTAAQATLGLRTTRAKDLDVPLYAFETSLGDGRVVAGARRLAKAAGLRSADVTLVDRSSTTSHLDPLAAAPARNDLVKTLVPFLRRVERQAR